jgi:hypothetical protein
MRVAVVVVARLEGVIVPIDVAGVIVSIDVVVYINRRRGPQGRQVTVRA